MASPEASVKGNCQEVTGCFFYSRKIKVERKWSVSQSTTIEKKNETAKI